MMTVTAKWSGVEVDDLREMYVALIGRWRYVYVLYSLTVNITERWECGFGWEFRVRCVCALCSRCERVFEYVVWALYAETRHVCTHSNRGYSYTHPADSTKRRLEDLKHLGAR